MKAISAVILTLVVVSLISLFYIVQFRGTRGLDLSFEAPEEILSGAPFDLRVNFSNNSGDVLEDARLTLTLPEGAAFFGADSQKNIDIKSLGNVGAGSLIQENYKIIVFSPTETLKEFRAAINYSPSALGARFDKSKSAAIEVKSAGITVDLDMPDEIVSGEEFTTRVVYKNVSEVDFSDLELKIEYPPSFSFSDSSLEPDENNNIWRLGDLRQNSEGEFTFTGNLIAAEGDALEFRTYLSVNAFGQTYPVNENSSQTVISSSPLSVTVHLNGDPNYLAKSGDNLNYTISYVNNTDTTLNNVKISAQLVGEMFDITQLQTQGLFRSADQVLSWDSSRVPALARVEPGSAGVVNFTLKVKDNYPVRSFSDKNFVLKVDVTAESPSSSGGGSRVFSKAKLETKVAGKVAIDMKAYFRDAESGILNKGSLPPRVGQPTNFTVHWIVKSFSVDALNMEMRGSLGNNVRLVGVPKSNIGSAPFYNQESNEVVWQIERLQANQGVIGSPVEAVFQIEATPTSENIGTYMPLVGPLTLTALDAFSGIELTASDAAVTTALPDDVTVGQQGGVVQP